jgi:hypothetical protein
VTWSITHRMTLSSAANESRHFFTKSSRAAGHRRLAFLLVSSNGPPAVPTKGFQSTGAVRVTLTRIAPRALDDDNLAYAFKHIRDGVTEAIGLRDDRDPRLTWLYSQERGKPAAIRITIEVRS